MAKKRKYNIEKLLDLLPRSISIEEFVKQLVKKGISERTFYRDRKIMKSDPSFIPSDRLEIYAGIFGVTVDYLKNYEVPKIKPIAERALKPLKKKTIKTGLK